MPGTGRDASAPSLRFDLLGPLAVHLDDHPVRLGSVKQRLLLAALLSRPNQAVRTGELTRVLWTGEPPPSAAANLRTYVLGLRRAVEPAAGAPRLSATSGGYLLRVEVDERDVDRFDTAAERGRSALDAGDASRAKTALTRAVTLWRGAPLDGLPLPRALAAWADRLQERRLLVEEDHAAALLALGGESEAVQRLRPLLEQHPLRQRAWGQLMVGLYRLGDVAGALDAFRAARAALAEQAGLDPAPGLSRLHDDILHNRAVLAERYDARPSRAPGPAPRPGCHELPPTVEPLVGRDADLATMLSWARGDDGPVIALHGPGGVGKSSLAVSAAHALAAVFPGGVLYADLRCTDPANVGPGGGALGSGAAGNGGPVRPVEALGRLLRALGVPGDAVPTETGEAGAAYRRELAGRGVLVVLDNADSAAQVAPLLPADPTCGVLVTSRRRLATLPRGRHLAVDPLTRDDAIALLAAAGAGQRATDDPDAAGRVADLCGQLPLALRTAGARLASRPQWSLSAFADRLADPARRLDELCYDDLRVRDALQPAYLALSAGTEHERECARAFRLLGVAPAPTVTLQAAAALVDRPADRTRLLLDTLADHRLLEPHQDGRYTLPELPRAYAHERARDEESRAARDEALRRLTLSYLTVADHAVTLDDAGTTADTDIAANTDSAADTNAGTGLHANPAWAVRPADVTRWIEAEHHTISALFTQASRSEGDLPELAVRLARACGGLCAHHGHPATARMLLDGAVDVTGQREIADQHIAALFDRARVRAATGDVHGALTDLLDCARVFEPPRSARPPRR